MGLMRLQKFLSRAGVCSRRKGETYISAGNVRVNHKVVTLLGTSVNPEIDLVEFNGQPVSIKDEHIYLALHKPKGYLTTCNQANRKIVLDLVDLEERIFPIGRLDKDSTGLLLLTNDGDLHHRLLHPSFDHEKEYEVQVKTAISDHALKTMAQGVVIMGAKTRPAEIKRISRGHFKIVLKEGRNRQIRRMVEKVGNQVVELKRIRIAKIELGHLPEGSWRYLTLPEKRGIRI